MPELCVVLNKHYTGISSSNTLTLSLEVKFPSVENNMQLLMRLSIHFGQLLL